MSEKVEITADQAVAICSLGGTVTLIEDAVQNLDDMRLDDDEIEALLLMPERFRMVVTARLLEMAEVMREALGELDFRVLQLTSGAEPAVAE